jgi:hypothetical protein
MRYNILTEIADVSGEPTASDFNILQRVEPLLGSDLKTSNETTFAVRQQILNKQVYATITRLRLRKNTLPRNRSE